MWLSLLMVYKDRHIFVTLAAASFLCYQATAFALPRFRIDKEVVIFAPFVCFLFICSSSFAEFIICRD